MHTTIVKRALIPLLLAAAGVAHATPVTFQGVTFTTTYSGNALTLQIDAAHPTGDWATATEIGALQLQSVGKFTGVTLTSSNPSGASAWAYSGQELNANGCSAGKAQTDKVACFYGSHLKLGDDMLFTFTFSGTDYNLTDPSVKVNFFETGGTTKIGSLFSQEVPASEKLPPPPPPPPSNVPEPQSLALLAGGAAIMGALRRRKTRKA